MENRNMIEPLLEKAVDYGRTSIELIKLKALDKGSAVASNIASRGIAILVLSMFTVIANIGIAMWLGDLLGKAYYGFFCVAGFYGMCTCVLFLMHNKIRTLIADSIITLLIYKK
jgi:hypothetical protein